MPFSSDGVTCRYIPNANVSISDKVPLGIWEFKTDQTGNYFLEVSDMDECNFKLYGDVESIANHVVHKYRNNKSNGNIGVLFYGKKGSGKSLTSRLIISKLRDTYPIILIKRNSDSLPDFLSKVTNCVLLFDEFEKNFDSDYDDEQSELLSALDGYNSSPGNLFLFTCNEVSKINRNFISRPGRILYRFGFGKTNQVVVEQYARDNLKNKDYLEEFVEECKTINGVTIDILSALISEINEYDITVEEALKYLNIDSFSKKLNIRIKSRYRDVGVDSMISDSDSDTVEPTNDVVLYNWWLGTVKISLKGIKFYDPTSSFIIPIENVKILESRVQDLKIQEVLATPIVSKDDYY